MEIKLFLQIIKRQIWWFVIPLVVVVAFSALFTLQQKSRYTAHFSLSAIPVSQAEGSSSYETLRSAWVFVATVRTWLHEEAVVARILKEAGIDPKSVSRPLTELFSAPYLENTFSLPIQITGQTKEETEKLSQAAIKIIKQQTQTFNQTSKTGLSFAIEASDPYIVEQKPNLKYNLLLGLVGGILLGLFVALSKHYIES